ncbi:unnamed protein product [Thlaspi arvense]|uniref:Bifunctional inhibitor/plant lipid transfer protein/seed storage helical domain-containing protein n=1 Tax=Thlaspi arvense TaxID=13288 RepID=A0AAU9T8J3_THLAR|nr:unnamed protein product [Thlaspi arvense]
MFAVGYPIEDVAPTASPMLPPAATPAGAAPDCLTVLANMSDCLTYVQAGSTQKKPDKGCCPELAGLVDSNPICLCQLLSKPDSYGVQVDVTKALKLPSVCSVQTPPVSTCADLGYPIRGMAPSEAPGVAGGDMPPGASPLALASGNQDSGGAYSENAVSLTRLSFLGAAFLTTLVF